MAEGKANVFYAVVGGLFATVGSAFGKFAGFYEASHLVSVSILRKCLPNPCTILYNTMSLWEYIHIYNIYINIYNIFLKAL